MKELNNINTFSSSDPLYFQIIDKIREGILVIDNNFKIKFANNGFLKLYLCKFEDIVGKNFFDIVGEENIS